MHRFNKSGLDIVTRFTRAGESLASPVASAARLGWRYLLLAAWLGIAVGNRVDAEENASDATSASPPPAQSLFDGQTLGKWHLVDKFDFADHGEVRVKDQAIVMTKGMPFTGVVYTGEVPRSNYRLTLQGQRIDGDDFFCGLTFPVQDSHCTLILGGWGGQVIGLSNIDGNSAIENSTTQAFEFQKGKWYRIQLTVTDEQITVLLDGKTLVDVETKGHKFSIWWEQEPMMPLGICTWNTTGAVKDLQLERLTAEDTRSSR